MAVPHGGRVAGSSCTDPREVSASPVAGEASRQARLALAGAVLTFVAATLCLSAHAGAATVYPTIGHPLTGPDRSQWRLDRGRSSPMIRANVQAPAPVGAHGMSYVSSVNWAGYAVVGGSGSFRTVQASFVIPKLLSCGLTEDSDSSYWAGLGGSGSQTVEQEGIDSACRNGVVYYIPWYEMYPVNPVNPVVFGGGLPPV
jgi:hypothetical protein